MEREEAIDKLQDLWNEVYNEDSDGYDYAVAIDMAIEALQTDVVRCKDCISCWQHDGIAECTFCGNRKVTPLNGYCHNAERKGGDPE